MAEVSQRHQCISSYVQFDADLFARYDDEKIKKKLLVKKPTWDCGGARWRLWRRLLVQEAHRRGLGT